MAHSDFWFHFFYSALNTWVIIEQSELHNRFLCNKIKEGVVITGKEELCSDFF